MIPGKNSNTQEQISTGQEKSKVGTFSIFSVESFIRRVIRSWYWFIGLSVLGYSLFYIYDKWYVQRVYASNLSLSISNSTASYLTPNQSINFIWGQEGNQDGVFLKKMVLSRSHNEYLVQELDLFVGYSTKGLLKSTYLDKYDSPVLVEVDKEHLQQVNYPITIYPKGNGKYEIELPEEGHSTHLYSYKTEGFKDVSAYERPANKVVSVNQWYETPNLRFRLVHNPNAKIKLDKIIINLSTVDQAVRAIISTINVEFDKELSSIMTISKKGYNLRETVSFLNQSVEKLIKKREEDKTLVDKNTLQYINDNLKKVRQKLDSSATNFNQLKIDKKMFSVEGKDQDLLRKIYDLEIKKADLLTKMNSLNNIRSSVSRSLEDLINVNTAGIEDGGFMATVSELKALYLKRLEMSTIYTPDSEPMREINKLINEARGKSYGKLNDYSSVYYEQLAKINDDIRKAELDLAHLPDDQRKYIDMEREYKVIETTYNTLLSKQAETQLRLATAKSDLTIIDPAKDLGQPPIGPNVAIVKYGLVFGFMLIPLLLILVTEIMDNRVKSIAELLGVIKIPLLGVIGKNLHENNLTVLEQPKSSISEAFRGIRANLRFLYNEDGNSKVILVTSSVGGEGKTYCSINIASVLGLSGKKTILLGMDLRKPKIFGDFKINNKYGISNYLSGDIEMHEIINKTKIPALDVATSGPIPPNPSELLMSDKNKEFIELLKKEYDFIIIDSPPVGLVADSFELMKLTDANVYVVRHEYTEKHMLRMVTEKYHAEEIKHLGLIYNDFVSKQGYG